MYISLQEYTVNTIKYISLFHHKYIHWDLGGGAVLEITYYRNIILWPLSNCSQLNYQSTEQTDTALLLCKTQFSKHRENVRMLKAVQQYSSMTVQQYGTAALISTLTTHGHVESFEIRYANWGLSNKLIYGN